MIIRESSKEVSMFISRKEYDELKENIKTLEGINRYYEKLADGDYGDSLVFLEKAWSEQAWQLDIKPHEGRKLITSIIKEIKILTGRLKKQK